MSSLQEEERLRPLTQTFVHRRHSIPVGFKFQWRIRWFGKQREVRKEKRKHVFQGKGKKKAWKEYWTEHQKNWLFGLDLVLRGWLTLDKPTDLCGVKLAYVCEEEVGRMIPRSPSALICLETKVSVVVFFFFFFFHLGSNCRQTQISGCCQEPRESGPVASRAGPAWASLSTHPPCRSISASHPSTAHTSLLDSLHRANWHRMKNTQQRKQPTLSHSAGKWEKRL